MEDELIATYNRIFRAFNEDTEGLEFDVGVTELNDGRKATVSLRIEVI